jgi:hypothetical protein
VIRLLLLWCLWSQDTNWPVLPPTLQQQPEVVAAYQTQLQGQNPEARRAAAQLVLDELPKAEVAAQADFVLGLFAAADFPADLLPKEIQRIYSEWPLLEQRIEDILRSAEGENLDLIPGAIKAAGLLELERPGLVESIGARLNQEQYQLLASQSLELITRHQFRTLESFHDWWKTARDLGRIDWMAQALDEALQAELDLWRRLLVLDPNSAMEAIDALRKEVRGLGYEALARLEISAEPGAPPALEIEAFRNAFDAETDTELRVRLLQLVPRFFQGQEAIGFMEEALASGQRMEKESAARLLQEVRPVELALESTVKHLDQAYQTFANGHAGTPLMRQSLWNSLVSLGRSKTEAMDPLLVGLDQIFHNAFTQEVASNVLPQVYQAVGLLGGDEFFRFVQPRIAIQTLSIQERQDALEAVIQLAQRFDKVDDFLETGLVAILNNEVSEIRYKALKSAGKLKHPKCTILLLQRLAVEPEEALKRELLKESRVARASGAVDLLLQFTPPNFWNEYRGALQAQIGGELVLAQQAILAMAERKDWEMAWRLMGAFNAPTDAAPEQLATYVALQTRVQAEWVIIREPKPKADDPEVVKALRMLLIQRQGQPLSPVWSELEGRLRTMLGEHAAAFEAFSAAIAQTPSGPEYDLLALSAVRAADAAGLVEKASQFVAALQPLAGDEAKAELASFKSKFDEAVAIKVPTPAVDGEPKETPPANADAGATEAGKGDGTDPKTTDPKSKTPPEKDDPAKTADPEKTTGGGQL